MCLNSHLLHPVNAFYLTSEPGCINLLSFSYNNFGEIGDQFS